MMIRLFIFAFFVFSGSVFAETVYKTVDEDGNVIFTDQPSESAEVIELQELQTIENPNPPTYRPPSSKSEEDTEASYYQAFSVVNPADGEGYRNNAGMVDIRLSLSPSLRRGHSVIVMMDGNEISSGGSLSVSLENVDRGTHSISAKVVDGSGQTLISTSSSFSLLRVAR